VLRAARWRAARHGLDESLIDVVAGELAPADAVVARLMEHIVPALDDWGERDRVTELVRRLLARGTSAHRQRIVFARRSTMDDVVDWLIDETAAS
jgi:carboxylate-amine ligase